MKKIILALTLCLLFLTGCNSPSEQTSSNKTDEITQHNADVVYTMVLDEDSEGIFAPYLSLDESNNTFLFTYDILSSYMPTGTYEIADGVLTAQSDDGKYTYLFDVIDDNTIEFKRDGSSDVKLTDGHSGMQIYDGAQFKAE